MSISLNHFIERTLGMAGLRLQRLRPYRSGVHHLAHKTAEAGVAMLLDVGANEGQFIQEFRRLGYRGGAVSFEPLESCHAKLRKAAAHDPNWTVAPRGALGARAGTVQINVSENLVSSSMLPISELSVRTHAPTRYVGQQEVQLRTLDSLLNLAGTPPFALKVDTQGFELEVLRGATETLKQTPLVLLEMSLVPLYEGAPGFAELYGWMENEGYRCISISEGFVNTCTNELLQADALFVKN